MTGAATNLTEKIESGRLAVSARDKVSSLSKCAIVKLVNVIQRLDEQSNQLTSVIEELDSLKANPPGPSVPPKDQDVCVLSVAKSNLFP